jgi:NAD(P)-dependent dehydrogenase (short-subunit alcohol dehydrogenase family)
MSVEEIKKQFETNFFGVIRVTKQVLPVMREQNSGIIVNVSSVGGRIGLPVLSAYHSTKFAMEGLSESILYEVEPFGIRVVIIEPVIKYSLKAYTKIEEWIELTHFKLLHLAFLSLAHLGIPLIMRHVLPW